jgi:hypothetical protein
VRILRNDIKPKHKKLVKFGLKAYTLRIFQSASSNARAVISKFSTAGRNCERLLSNVIIGEELNCALVTLAGVTRSSVINVDHTDVNYLIALIGAVQTYNGRAVPVFVETTFAGHIPSFGSEHSTQRTNALRTARKIERRTLSFSDHIIFAIQNFINRLGFSPKFAFDRGFGSTKLMHFLDSVGAKFYIRLKSGRIVDDGYHQLCVKDIKNSDEAVEVDNMILRLIRSDISKRCKEPWYILTNDFTSSRGKIIQIYYHRFEIEEMFKDIKHLFDLKKAKFNKPNSLKVILILVLIGLVLLFRFREDKVFRYLAQRRKVPKNPHKTLSWVREAWEIFQSGLFYRGGIWSG